MNKVLKAVETDVFPLRGRDLDMGTIDQRLEKLNQAAKDLIADSSLVGEAIEAKRKADEAKPRIDELYEEYVLGWKEYAELMLANRNKFICGICEDGAEIKERSLWRVYMKDRKILFHDAEINKNNGSGEYKRYVIELCKKCSASVRQHSDTEKARKKELRDRSHELQRTLQNFGRVRTKKDQNKKAELETEQKKIDRELAKSNLVREVEFDSAANIGYRYVDFERSMVRDDKYMPPLEVYHRLANRFAVALPPLLLREGEGGYQITIKTAMTI